MINEYDLMSKDICSVIAPAGCGKTELIVSAVASQDNKHFLVLTHTHAGARALRTRFKKRGVSRDRVKIETIAGWSLSYVHAYPKTSAFEHKMPTGKEWDQTYEAADKMLSLNFIQKILRCTYDGVFVDEYQDCTRVQHKLICKLASVIPCRVLGDPLQGIFEFAGASLSWKDDVESFFPSIGTLNFPWRWKDKNEKLGLWLVSIREALINGAPINLEGAPITLRKLDPQNQRKSALELLNKKEQVVIIRKMSAQAHHFARGIGRAYVSMEEIECKDLFKFAKEITTLEGNSRVLKLIDFGKKCMTGLSEIANLEKKFVKNEKISLDRMSADKRAIAEAFLDVANTTNYSNILTAVKLMENIKGIRIFREELWWELQKTLESFTEDQNETLAETAWKIRNRSRFSDRSFGRYIVSRTLLIKGLEFDHSLIVDVGEFAGADSAKHFYVAATRGSKSLSLLSETSTLQFPPLNL